MKLGAKREGHLSLLASLAIPSAGKLRVKFLGSHHQNSISMVWLLNVLPST